MMNTKSAFEKYFEAVHDVSRERANDLINNLLAEGYEPETIVFEVISPSLEKMVKEFMEKRVILSQHFVATKISDEIIDFLLPKFKKTIEKKINVVIGCASGDFHGLGKKIVIGSLKANIINVVDLGLNVKAEKFVEDAIINNAQIIGVSSMMVHSAIGENGPRKIRKILKEKGLEDKIKLIVGGAPYKFDPDLYLEAKADAWATNGLEAVSKVIELDKLVQNANQS